MNIIFITIAYPRSSEESNLYSDLMDEFAGNGHKVYVACSIEERYGIDTNLLISNGIHVLRIQTGNITSNPNYIGKGLALLQLQSQFIHAINKNFKEIAFDLILYSTPPIQYNRIIKFLKSKSNARTYLLLKDIFPQNALDLGLLAKWNPLYYYFKQKERQTYQLSDLIGCMSPANVNYLRKNNTFPQDKIIEVCPNSLKYVPPIGTEERISIRNQVRNDLGIKNDELLLIYGGNLGISQGIPFLLEILKRFETISDIKFLIVGEGTWFTKIERYVTEQPKVHVKLMKRVTPLEFRKMLLASDLGLIFLNPSFTIPNFPSRLTSYLEAELPVICCTDTATDIGDIVEDAGCGYKLESGNVNSFADIVENICNAKDQLKQLSFNARILFEKEYTTRKSYAVITSHFGND